MIIGLTGSFGAGKGVVVDYLKTKGFRHYSARQFITEEITRRNLPLNRDSMIEVGNDLRAKHGPSYIIETLLEQAKAAGGNAVVESLRAVAEVRRFQEMGAFVMGVDADPAQRYQRIVGRGNETDQVSFAEWQDQERRESNPDDPTKQDIFGALKASNLIIQNDGTLEELGSKIDAVLASVDSPAN